MHREMKNSGIEWIGEVPCKWKITKLKNHVKINNGKDNQIKDGDIPVYGSGGVFGYTDNYIYDGESVLLGRKGTIDKPQFVEGKFWTVDTAFYTIPRDMTNIRYFYYCAKSINFSKYTYGTALPSMTQSILNQIELPLPEIAEQQKIAAFLDSTVLQIDAIIGKTRETIEEHKKYKQVIITEAVTKGLDPDAEMKDSGIEWIGMMPEHWQLLSFKRILNERLEKNIPIKTDERLSLSIDKGVTPYSEKTTNLDRFKDDVSLYKLAHVGDFVLNSMNMIVGAVGVSNYFGCVSPAYYTYYDNEVNHITVKFCDYLFKSKTIKKVLFSLGKGIMAIDRGDDKINTCRLKVSREDLRSLKLPLPNVSEQNQIVAFLDGKCSEIDILLDQKQKLVEEMESFKKSLIYECVTGKREVPEI